MMKTHQMILVFYWITPLFLYRYSHTKTIILSLFILLSLITIHLTIQLIELQLPLYFVPFAVGILVGRAEVVYIILHSKYAVGIGIATFLSMCYMPQFDHEILQMILVDVAILAAIPPFLAMGHRLVQWVPIRIISFVSVSSFAAYLIHRFTFTLGLKFYHPSDALSSLVYLGLVILPLTFAIAYIVQDAYEGLLQLRFLNKLRECVRR